MKWTHEVEVRQLTSFNEYYWRIYTKSGKRHCTSDQMWLSRAAALRAVRSFLAAAKKGSVRIK